MQNFSPQALFDPVPSHRLFPAGNLAIWVARLAQENMLEEMQCELSVKPELR